MSAFRVNGHQNLFADRLEGEPSLSSLTPATLVAMRASKTFPIVIVYSVAVFLFHAAQVANVRSRYLHSNIDHLLIGLTRPNNNQYYP